MPFGPRLHKRAAQGGGAAKGRKSLLRTLMKKFIAVPAWWVSLLFTSFGVALLLVKGMVMGTLPGSSVTLSCGIITLLAVASLSDQRFIKIKSGGRFRAADVSRNPARRA
jgi:hypothetical protein